MKIHVPGKLILSGEHAVVYGCPALAMAIKPGITTTVSSSIGKSCLFDLPHLPYQGRYTVLMLKQMKTHLKKKYEDFLSGQINIQHVLTYPHELVVLAWITFLDAFSLSSLRGTHICVESHLPLGSGMGSSAAAILSMMHAASIYFNQPVSVEKILQLAQEVENMQHGQSSGLDLHIIEYGGYGYWHQGTLYQRPLPEVPLYLINTGKPKTTTGQCVAKAAFHFKSVSLRQDFAEVTDAMDQAITRHKYDKLIEAIRNNHRLLVAIGVVPEKIKQLIDHIELLGGAAKICGAGAVAGHHAGAVLVAIENEQILFTLCEQIGYPVIRLDGVIGSPCWRINHEKN